MQVPPLLYKPALHEKQNPAAHALPQQAVPLLPADSPAALLLLPNRSALHKKRNPAAHAALNLPVHDTADYSPDIPLLLVHNPAVDIPLLTKSYGPAVHALFLLNILLSAVPGLAAAAPLLPTVPLPDTLLPDGHSDTAADVLLPADTEMPDTVIPAVPAAALPLSVVRPAVPVPADMAEPDPVSGLLPETACSSNSADSAAA